MAGQHADPDRVRTREDLARELTVLRSQSGLTVRDVAKRVGSPAATVGDYFAGRHLPGPRQLPLYRAILDACGVSQDTAVEAWLDALSRVRLSSDGRTSKVAPPYRGLEPFRESDAERFFGRKGPLEELSARVRELGEASGCGLVVLVGPSGSGKSSLLMAGLIPAVNRGALDTPGTAWTAESVTPDRLEALGAAPARAGRAVLVVIDQFEEVLTAADERRSRVLEQLAALADTTLVVLALRADFYQVAAAEEVLLSALRHQQILLGPMTAEELREAILGPARQVGAPVEDGLVELILADLAPGGRAGFAHDPGVLPLLSYALLATWERAGRNQLTVADYLAVGGLRGAVLQSAERLYQSLDPEEQDVARRLFARLVRVDADAPPTRRRATRAELLETGDAERDRLAAEVLERFIAARLLTIDVETVQVSHEALLNAWPRLAEWVESDREWLHLHQQLSDAARTWFGGDQDDSLLWRGTRVERATEQAAGPGRELNRVEAEFLLRSVSARDAERRAERRRVRRSQQLLAAVAALAAAACVLAGVAISSRSDAVRARDEALSRQVAIESQQLRASDPSLAAQLALAAYRIFPTVQARSTLVDATAGEVPFRLLGPPGPLFVGVAADAGLLAVAQSGTDTVALYHPGPGRPARLSLVTAGPASDQDFAVALSPDGTLMAVGGTGGDITVWDTTRPTRPVELTAIGGLAATVYSLAFSPGGQRLAAADSDGSLRQWSLTDPRHPVVLGRWQTPARTALKAVAYTPDGSALIAAGAGGTVAVWQAGQTAPYLAPGAGSAAYQTVSVSPNGRLLAAGATDHKVHIWEFNRAGRLQAGPHPIGDGSSEIDSTAFSPDSGTLAVGSAGGTLRLYDTTTWVAHESFQHPAPVTGVGFLPGGGTLVSTDSGGTTRLWPLPTTSSLNEPGSVFYLGYANAGRHLYVVSDGSNSDVTVWDTTNPMRPTRQAEIRLPAGMGPVAGAGAISPNGHLLAAADKQARIQLIDVSDISHPVPIGIPLTGATSLIEQVGFAPSGKLLIAGDDSGQLLLWDVSDPVHPRLLAAPRDTHGEVLGFSVSPNGRILADAATDGKVRIYDITNPGHPTLVATVGGFSDYAYDTVFTPDGRTLIAGSADGTIRMWDITDPAHPRLLGQPLSGPSGYVFALSVSPDGRTLAATSTNHAVWLWNITDVKRPQLADTLGSAKGAVFAVTFTPNGQVLAAGGSDHAFHLWTYRPADAIGLLCTASGQGITRTEWSHYVQGLAYNPPCR